MGRDWHGGAGEPHERAGSWRAHRPPVPLLGLHAHRGSICLPTRCVCVRVWVGGRGKGEGGGRTVSSMAAGPGGIGVCASQPGRGVRTCTQRVPGPSLAPAIAGGGALRARGAELRRPPPPAWLLAPPCLLRLPWPPAQRAPGGWHPTAPALCPSRLTVRGVSDFAAGARGLGSVQVRGHSRVFFGGVASSCPASTHKASPLAHMPRCGDELPASSFPLPFALLG